LHDRSIIFAGWRGRLRALRRLRATFAASLTPMIVGLIYAVAAVGVAIYMLVALVRPDKF
jgi:hypothetical protein